MGEPKKPDLPPLNPLFDVAQQQAAQDEQRAMQIKVQGDSASLLARYGTRLAMANANSPSVMSSGFGKTA